MGGWSFRPAVASGFFALATVALAGGQDSLTGEAVWAVKRAEREVPVDGGVIRVFRRGQAEVFAEFRAGQGVPNWVAYNIGHENQFGHGEVLGILAEEAAGRGIRWERVDLSPFRQLRREGLSEEDCEQVAKLIGGAFLAKWDDLGRDPAARQDFSRMLPFFATMLGVWQQDGGEHLAILNAEGRNLEILSGGGGFWPLKK